MPNKCIRLHVYVRIPRRYVYRWRLNALHYNIVAKPLIPAGILGLTRIRETHLATQDHKYIGQELWTKCQNPKRDPAIYARVNVERAYAAKCSLPASGLRSQSRRRNVESCRVRAYLARDVNANDTRCTRTCAVRAHVLRRTLVTVLINDSVEIPSLGLAKTGWVHGGVTSLHAYGK